MLPQCREDGDRDEDEAEAEVKDIESSASARRMRARQGGWMTASWLARAQKSSSGNHLCLLRVGRRLRRLRSLTSL